MAQSHTYIQIAEQYVKQMNEVFDMYCVISIDHENKAYGLRIGEFEYQFDTPHELAYACQIARNTRKGVFL